MKRHWRLTSESQPTARITPVGNPHGQIFPAGNPKMINGNILVDYPGSFVGSIMLHMKSMKSMEIYYGTIPWLDRDPLRLFSEAPDTAHSLGTWQGLWSHKCQKKCQMIWTKAVKIKEMWREPLSKIIVFAKLQSRLLSLFVGGCYR